jgi:hypothetical protein
MKWKGSLSSIDISSQGFSHNSKKEQKNQTLWIERTNLQAAYTVSYIFAHYDLFTFNSSEILQLIKWILGVPKSSGEGTLFSYRKLTKKFLSHEQTERLSLYFSMLFDHYSTGIILIKFR